MNYKDSLNYIHSTPKLGKHLGHENISYTLNLLGNPEKKLKFIHIAGTNGKGSVAGYISSVLTCAGFRTGKFISPYILSFNERIAINNSNIDDGSLARITTRVREAIDEMKRKTGRTLSEFEVVTVIGFSYFMEQGCDYVVLETGVGGRFDATNVIEAPLVSVITNIDFDHMKYLGDTIAKIAFEKCGIIKPNRPTVNYPCQKDEAIEVIVEQAKTKGSPLFIAKAPKIKSQSLMGNIFDYKDLKDIKTTLLGEYQILNAATALEAILLLRSAYNITIEDKHIYEGMEAAKNIGRFEVISKDPLIILDGAHNPNGVTAFLHSLKQYTDGKRIIAVMGMLADKSYQQCVLAVSLNAQHLIATTVSSMRTATPEDLVKYADDSCKTTICKNPIDALRYAKSIADFNSVICVVGSLYLLGDILSAKGELL